MKAQLTMTFPSPHPALGRALAARDYSVPTAVQLAVLEPEAVARDMLVSAQTGSGKTVAFGLAIARTLLDTSERFERAADPMAMIIAPTRELAMQVQQELVWLFAETGARIVTCVGGMDARTEARELETGAHIVVGTPGRLRDHLERRRLRLAGLKTIVLDEADEMLDLGFREDLEVILDATPATRQTLLFSATMPRDIEALAQRYQRDAKRIETIRRDEQHADIDYRALRVAPHDIEHAVVNVLRYHEMRATLVFCATRESVKRLHARLTERGFSAVALSGELSQSERTHALQAVRDGRARVLVATDVAARGLDLPDLALVIHADLPNDGETLLHRSGRTGRAGRKGICLLIVPYNRRRKAEVLLGSSKVKVTWVAAPTADEIRARDQERFLADRLFTDPATEDDAALARGLQAARSADEIALALVRMQRAQLPAPEDLAEDTGPPRREDRTSTGRNYVRRDRPGLDRNAPDRGEREGGNRNDAVNGLAHSPPPRQRWKRDSRPGAGDAIGTDREPRAPRAHRDDAREMVWFRLNIGRDRNADPRWLLPLICRAGNVSKAEIGAIKIYDRDTRFQIVAEFAEQFAHTVRTSPSKEGHITRVGAHSAADTAAAAGAIDAIGKPAPTAPAATAHVTAPMPPVADLPTPVAHEAAAAVARVDAGTTTDGNRADAQRGARRNAPDKVWTKKPYEKKPWRARGANASNHRPDRNGGGKPDGVAASGVEQTDQTPNRPRRDDAVPTRSPRDATQPSTATAVQEPRQHTGKPFARPGGKPFGHSGGKPGDKPFRKSRGGSGGKSFGPSRGTSDGKPFAKSRSDTRGGSGGKPFRTPANSSASGPGSETHRGMRGSSGGKPFEGSGAKTGGKAAVKPGGKFFGTRAAELSGKSRHPSSGKPVSSYSLKKKSRTPPPAGSSQT